MTDSDSELVDAMFARGRRYARADAMRRRLAVLQARRQRVGDRALASQIRDSMEQA